jgi:capsular exopolysaccharide synthesis family protein
MLDQVKTLKSPAQDAAAEAEGFDLRDIANFLWRRWKFIASVTALAALVGTVYLSRQTPVYTANTQILLDPHKASKALGQDEAVTFDLASIEGQMAIIRSTVFLRRVVEKERLVNDPEFGSAPAASDGWTLVAAVKSFFSRNSAPDPGSDARKSAQEEILAGVMPADVLATIGNLQGALVVTRTGQAYLINIAFTSADPARAARLANAVADAFAVDQLDARFEAAKRASAWLSDRLVDLRKQLRESEEAVAQFRAQNNLAQASSSATLSQEQLGQLNGSLVSARTEAAEKKAQLDILQKIENKGGDVALLPEVMNAPAIADLRKQAADLSRQEADLRTRYSDKHPALVNIHAQMQDVRREIAAEAQRSAAKISEDYQLAQARQDAIAKALQEVTGQTDLDASKAITLRELERTAAVNKSLFEDFLQRARLTDQQSTFEVRDSRVITPALPPATPSAPKKALVMLIAVVSGLMAGVGGAYAIELLNAGFTTPRQVEDLLHLPLLASISHMRETDLAIDGKATAISMLPLLRPISRYSEAIRSLRSGIQMADVDHPPKVLQVTSTLRGEGKTTLSLSLAASAAQSGLKVLFIDCDLRHPSASRFFGLEKEKGIVEYLIGEVELKDVLRFQETSRHWVLPAGGNTQNPSDLLGSDRLKKLVEQLRTNFDLIVVDTAPMGPVVDATVVAQHLADTVVFVARWASTAREMVQRSVQQLSGHAKIAGIVFNRVDDAQAQKYGKYAYSYYYGGGNYYKKYYRD